MLKRKKLRYAFFGILSKLRRFYIIICRCFCYHDFLFRLKCCIVSLDIFQSFILWLETRGAMFLTVHAYTYIRGATGDIRTHEKEINHTSSSRYFELYAFRYERKKDLYVCIYCSSVKTEVVTARNGQTWIADTRNNEASQSLEQKMQTFLSTEGFDRTELELWRRGKKIDYCIFFTRYFN